MTNPNPTTPQENETKLRVYIATPIDNYWMVDAGSGDDAWAEFHGPHAENNAKAYAEMQNRRIYPTTPPPSHAATARADVEEVPTMERREQWLKEFSAWMTGKEIAVVKELFRAIAALESALADASVYKDLYAKAVAAASKFLQCGGPYAYLLKLGDDVLMDGPAVFAKALDAMTRERDLAKHYDNLITNQAMRAFPDAGGESDELLLKKAVDELLTLRVEAARLKDEIKKSKMCQHRYTDERGCCISCGAEVKD